MKIHLPLMIAGGVLLAVAPAGATTIDLTGGGTETINGAIFTTTSTQSTGSGVIDPFVRLSTNDDVADGYNATVRPVMDDVNTSPTFTHDLLLSAVGEVTIGTTAYYEFLLDINQTHADPFISLDELQIYTRTTALTSADELSDLQSAGSTLRYDLDTGDPTNTVLLNYALNSGSGSGDLFVYVEKSLFPSESLFLYLYSEFGATVPHNNNDGFEEWATRTPVPDPPTVPDGGSTLTLLGAAMGLFGLARVFARQ